MTTDGNFAPWPAAARKSYTQAGYWIGKLLTDILDRQRTIAPNKIALAAGEKQLTFTQLDAAANRLAARLEQQGVQREDHALVQLPNSLEFYIAFWALLKIGVRPVFALFNHGEHELNTFHSQLAPKLLLWSRQHRLSSKRLNFHAPITIYIEDENIADDQALHHSLNLALRPKASANDVAFYQLSGGSTSTPKLIPRTHDDYYYSVRRSAEVCEVNTNTVYLCALPAPHNFPLSSPGVLGVWYAGGTVVVAEDPSPSACFSLIARHGVTMTSLVPPLVTLWLQTARHHREKLQTLELLQVGGARLSESIAQRIEPELGCRLQQVFGMAEGLVCYTRLDDDAWHRRNTQGRPMSEADEIKIVDDRDRPLADGIPGHLLTRGPYTIRGYYRAGDYNQQVFDESGFYRTGDIVIRMPSGHLKVVGRVKDQINRGGEKVAAEEVESLLLTHPDILHAAVVAIPDEALGEKICAFLVCDRAMPKLHMLRKHLRLLGLADYKLPDQCMQLDKLPLTPVGKPDKTLLRLQMLQNGKELAIGDS